MITDAENKSIPGPRMRRVWLSPSAPNAERIVCGTCQQEDRGSGITHSPNCAWAIEHKARRIGQAEVETK